MLGLSLFVSLSYARAGLAGDADSGLALGLRTGVQAPALDFGAAILPIQIDAGYRLSSHWVLGAYAEYGITALGRTCGACSEHFVRLGVEAQYHFGSPGTLHPWLGVGAGWDWVSEYVEGDLARAAYGPELVSLRLGLDAPIGDHERFAVGPFAGFALSYIDDTECSGQLECEAVQRDRTYPWLTLGVHGSFVAW
jgi:hypothetical protein